jgi:outer membrane protein OmpA-like peptidoglycan-associated protein/tetratricopeptide (TPR) repeat protein
MKNSKISTWKKNINNMVHLLTALIFLFAFAFSSCKAQMPGKYSSTNKKAIEHYEKALRYYDVYNNAKAKEELEAALNKDDHFIEAYNMLGYVYYDLGQNENAIINFNKALEINPNFFPNIYYSLSKTEVEIGKYQEAKSHAEKLLTYPNVSEKLKATSRQIIQNCEFALIAISKPVPFNPINMGRNINSKYAEYFPAITVDGNSFLFTRKMSYEKETGRIPQEDFYFSRLNNKAWEPAQPVNNINTTNNEGAPAFSADGRILFFVACAEQYGYGPNRNGQGSCDIFASFKTGNNWSLPENLGTPVNTGRWESQPSFSSDGKTLYFVYGNGKDASTNDIYQSEIKEDGTWDTPKKLSNKINTPLMEESIFIHPDNQTLYFSSNGHVGMGGLDIYMSRRQADGEWGEAVNLGYPINTYSDENSLLVGPSGDIAYFASDRKGGFGDLDLYQFELYKEAQPQKITYVKGKVYDVKTKKPLEANFELIDLGTSKTFTRSYSDGISGEFFLTLPANKDYALNVSKPGYLFYSENFSLKESADINKPFFIDVPLQPIDTGSVVELKNVFFETAKYDLKPESKAELQKLVNFLTTNPRLKIQLSGHTDDVGDDKSNMILSNNRAKSVYDYLITNGISKDRLTYKGYGETRPKLPNINDENRAINRRTEFKVIAK